MSISTLEKGLVAYIQNSPIGDRVRIVNTLPDLDGRALVDQFTTDAPAIYVSYATSTQSNEQISRRFGIAVIARNSRGHDEARHGDGATIGLYEMINFIESLIHNATIANAGFSVRSDRAIKSEPMFKAGLYGAVIDIEAPVLIDSSIDIDSLDDFKTFKSTHKIADAAPTSSDSVTLPII